MPFVMSTNSSSEGGSVSIYTETKPGGIDATEPFPKNSAESKLFRVAFGVINRKDSSKALSKYIGNIKAYYKKWASDGTLTYELLASHACTDAELKANFY